MPSFLFLADALDAGKLLAELKQKLDERCAAFGPEAEAERADFYDSLAMCDEELMECFLEQDALSDGQIAEAIAERRIFPCYFGSALKLTGVKEFLDGICRYACEIGCSRFLS